MDGAAVAREILGQVAKRAADFTLATGVTPCLATVIVGEDPSSVTYVRMKQNRSRKVGIASRHVGLPATTTTQDLVSAISELSADPAVHGILLQHPVPPQIDERAAFEAIAPAQGRRRRHHALVRGHGVRRSRTSPPPPPAASCACSMPTRSVPSGRHAVVIGRSPILGKPVGMLLLARDATVTYCHSRTRDLPGIAPDRRHPGRGGGQAGVRPG